MNVSVNGDPARLQVTVTLVLWNIGQPRSSVATGLPPLSWPPSLNLHPYMHQQQGDKISLKKMNQFQ